MPDQYGYYNFTTVGQLNNTISSPSGGSAVKQGTNISITTYIYNYCQEPMQIDTDQITFNLSTGGTSYLCDLKQRIGENVYTCQWSTYNRTDGTYNFTMSTYEDDYYNDTELEEDAFNLQTIPILKFANVTDRTESWSLARNYSVKVIDNLDDAVTVTLYIAVGALEESYGTRCCGPAEQCPSNPGNCTNITLEWNNVWLNSTYDCTSYAEMQKRPQHSSSLQTTPSCTSTPHPSP